MKIDLNKNNPRLGGLLLDVIPRRLMAQPLDEVIISYYYNIFNGVMSIIPNANYSNSSKLKRSSAPVCR